MKKSTRFVLFGAVASLLGAGITYYMLKKEKYINADIVLEEMKSRVENVTGSWIQAEPQLYHQQQVYVGGLTTKEYEYAFTADAQTGAIVEFNIVE